jgi:hypothetical protein
LSPLKKEEPVPKKAEEKKPEAQKEAPKSLMQVTPVEDPKDAEFEKDFVDVDEDAEDDEQPKAKEN